jgi:hypothetical protein
MRRIFTLLTLLLLLGCTPPGQQRVGWYDAQTDTVHLDPQSLARWEAAYPGMAAWWQAHERGHRTYLRLFRAGLLDYGPGLVGQERGAQCAARAELQTVPAWTEPTAGYWECPEDALRAFRQVSEESSP